MRTIRFITITLFGFILVCSLGSLSSAHAEEDNYHPVYPNVWESDINQPCPKGSDKMFIAVLTVPRHQQILEYGEMYLELQSGRFLFDDAGYQVSQRRVEFYFFPPSRKARVLLNDLRDSLVYVDFTGYYYSLKLKRQCVEQFES